MGWDSDSVHQYTIPSDRRRINSTLSDLDLTRDLEVYLPHGRPGLQLPLPLGSVKPGDKEMCKGEGKVDNDKTNL